MANEERGQSSSFLSFVALVWCFHFLLHTALHLFLQLESTVQAGFSGSLGLCWYESATLVNKDWYFFISCRSLSDHSWYRQTRDGGGVGQQQGRAQHMEGHYTGCHALHVRTHTHTSQFFKRRNQMPPEFYLVLCFLCKIEELQTLFC